MRLYREQEDHGELCVLPALHHRVLHWALVWVSITRPRLPPAQYTSALGGAMAKGDTRRVTVTLVLSEDVDTDIPWTEQDVRTWLQQGTIRRVRVSDGIPGNELIAIESVVFPDGEYDEISPDDLAI